MSYFIYIYYNKDYDVLYVGKTTDFIKRDKGHKQKKWYEEVDYVKIAEVASQADQTIYEVYYINKLNPIYNNKQNYTNRPSIKLPALDFKVLSVDMRKEIIEKNKRDRKEKLDFLMRNGIVVTTFKSIRNENQKISFFEVFKSKVYFNYVMNGRDELVVFETIHNMGVFEE